MQCCESQHLGHGPRRAVLMGIRPDQQQMRTRSPTKGASVKREPQQDAPGAAASDAEWNDSIASMLISTANFWRRSGNAYYRELFGITITEVAILSLLDTRAPLTLNAI